MNPRGDFLSDFRIEKSTNKISSINRTIRLKPEHFDKLMQLSKESGISFNGIVGQCIEYALKNLEKDNSKK